MLEGKSLIAFVPTVKPAAAKAFYKDAIGLKLLSEDNFAMVFDANGTILRVTTVRELKPQEFTILGWNVDDIVSTIKSLNQKNIICERYGFFEQDDLGIWVSPNGAKVAWFKDADGNILSITEG